MIKTIAEAKEYYIANSNDQYIKEHYFLYMGDCLKVQKTVDWLILRLNQDKTHLKNLDGSLVIEDNESTWFEAMSLFK